MRRHPVLEREARDVAERLAGARDVQRAPAGMDGGRGDGLDGDGEPERADRVDGRSERPRVARGGG